MELTPEERRRLGARVRELRRARGMTQERLAEAAGISAPYVAQVETGSATPSLPALLRIAEAMSVPVSGLASALDPAEAEETHALRGNLAALAEALPPARLRLLLRIAAALSEDDAEAP